MQSTQVFAEKYGIEMEPVLTDHNPNMDEMPEGTRHWRCTFRGIETDFEVIFSMGPALEREPSAAEVLDALASDAAGYENAIDADNEQPFEAWADEYGLDTDSRRHERTFRAVEDQSKRLRAWLGDAPYEELLWETERD